MTDKDISDRVAVGELLRLVRLGSLSVRQAMLQYPRDVEDESLIAAYHALIHYEADEDLRNRDLLYKEEQDDYLEFLSETLKNGQDLPANIIENYKSFYNSAPILHEDSLLGKFKSFWKNLNIKDD